MNVPSNSISTPSSVLPASNIPVYNTIPIGPKYVIEKLFFLGQIVRRKIKNVGKSKEISTGPPELPHLKIYSPDNCQKSFNSKNVMKQPSKNNNEHSCANLKGKDIPMAKIYGYDHQKYSK